jgi:hypothetical protein
MTRKAKSRSTDESIEVWSSVSMTRAIASRSGATLVFSYSVRKKSRFRLERAIASARIFSLSSATILLAQLAARSGSVHSMASSTKRVCGSWLTVLTWSRSMRYASSSVGIFVASLVRHRPTLASHCLANSTGKSCSVRTNSIENSFDSSNARASTLRSSNGNVMPASDASPPAAPSWPKVLSTRASLSNVSARYFTGSAYAARLRSACRLPRTGRDPFAGEQDRPEICGGFAANDEDYEWLRSHHGS